MIGEELRVGAVARVLQPDGQLFIYTRTPQQNARTIWGRYFPGFTEHEQRLRSEAAFRDAIRQTAGLTMVASHTFKHRRSSTAERLRAQAEGHHYSTFSLYSPDELRASIAAFLSCLPSPRSPGLTSTSWSSAGATATRRSLTVGAARQAGRSGFTASADAAIGPACQALAGLSDSQAGSTPPAGGC